MSKTISKHIMNADNKDLMTLLVAMVVVLGLVMFMNCGSQNEPFFPLRHVKTYNREHYNKWNSIKRGKALAAAR